MTSAPAPKGLLDTMAKGVAANGFGQLVALLTLVVSVPIFLNAWGSHLYGEWLLLSLIPVYLAISDLGFSTAAGVQMTVLVAQGDRPGALRLLQCTWTLITLISAAVCFLLVGLLHLFPITTLLDLTMLGRSEANGIAVLLILLVCASQQGGIIEAIYRCDGHYATGTLFLNLARFVEFVGGLGVVLAGGDPWHYAATLVVLRLAGYVVMWADLRKRVPWARPAWVMDRLSEAKPLLLPAVGFVATPLAYALSIQGILLAVGHVYSPTMVTVVSLHRTLARMVWQLAFMVSQTASVELSRALGPGDTERARRIYRLSWQAVLWSTSIASGLLLVFARQIFDTWVRSKVEFHPLLLAIFLLASVIGGLWGVSLVVPVSLNRHHKLTAVFVLVTFLAFWASFPLLRLWGLEGGAWAVVAAEVFMFVIVTRAAWRMLDEKAGQFWPHVLAPPFGIVRAIMDRAGGGDKGPLPHSTQMVLAGPSKYHLYDLAFELQKKGALRALMSGYLMLRSRHRRVPSRNFIPLPYYHFAFRVMGKFGLVYEYVDKVVFDWLASRTIPTADVYHLIAGSAIRTIRAAHARGKKVILDRPCSHIVVQNRLLAGEFEFSGVPFPGIDPRVIRQEEIEYAEADVITVPSDFAKQSFVEMGFADERVVVIPYGVNLQRFHPVGKRDPKKFVALFVGYASVRKSVPRLLKAFENVHHPHKSLLLVGQVAPEIKKHVFAATKTGNVKAIGHMPQENLKAVMSRATVLVLPSIEDGYGLVMSQAMACGTTVIASTNTGAGMLITHGENGLIVPAGDTEAITAALQQLADDPELVERLGSAALERARSLGGWESYAEKILGLAESVRNELGHRFK
ncbi:MAG: glycosyltransferase [Fimbriimonadaceae bacterium]